MKRTLRRSSCIIGAGALALLLSVLAIPATAQTGKRGQSGLDKLAFARPELRVSRTLTDAERLPKGMCAIMNKTQWEVCHA